MMIRVVVTILTLLLISCSVPKYGVQYHLAPEFSLAETKGKTVGLFVAGPGRVSGYEKGFAKVYGEKEAFITALEDAVKVDLSARGLRMVKVALPMEKRAGFTEELHEYKQNWQDLPETLRQTAGETARSLQLDYLLVITHYTITGKWEGRPGAPTPHGSGGRTAKMCYVTIRGGILKPDGRVLYFGEASGKAEVGMFAFKTALKSGVRDAVSKFGQLLTGRMPAENISVL